MNSHKNHFGPHSLIFVCVVCINIPFATSQAGELINRIFFNGGQAQTTAARVVDLSHPLDFNTIFWPGFPNFNISHLISGNTAGGFWLEANWVSTSEHGGTHVDAPAHFSRGGQHLHEIPPDKFIGPAVLVDATTQASLDADFQLEVEELREWERAHGQIPADSVVLINFGWSPRYPNRLQYFNTRTPEDPATFHFPGIALDTLRWMVEQRGVKMIGVDVPSLDSGQEPAFRGHRYLCANGIPFVENLNNLEQLPVEGMTIFAVPLKVVGGSGCPVRAFALVNNGVKLFGGHWWLLIVVALMVYSVNIIM